MYIFEFAIVEGGVSPPRDPVGRGELPGPLCLQEDDRLREGATIVEIGSYGGETAKDHQPCYYMESTPN